MSRGFASSKSIMSDEVIGRSVFSGALATPFVVLKESAVANNVARMAQYVEDRSVSLAPHAKTTMTPVLFRRQLDAGAWGLTVATMSQVRVLVEFGVERILLANQLVDPAAIQWLASSGLEAGRFMCFVDSEVGVRILEEAGGDGCFDVLLEVGASGARTGVRTEKEALIVASAVERAANVRLVGVSGYEGSVARRDDYRRSDGIDDYLKSIKGVAVCLSDGGFFDGLEEVVVSAGASLYFDRAVEILGPPWSLPTRTRLILRCGSYVTSDAGRYLESSPFADRVSGYGHPETALELWSHVLSRPEPTRALLDFGKRDVPFDNRLPTPLLARTRRGRGLTADGLIVRDLNDHHAFLEVPARHLLEVGDVIGFGLHHPCTAFDKWRCIPLISDDYVVTDLVDTYF